MLDATEAFAIHNLKYGDTSLISYCFTEKYGLRSFMLKGILSGKRKAIKKSLFQPMSHIEIVAQFRDNQNLSFIKEAKLVAPHSSIPFDVRKNALVLFLSEILYQVLREEGAPNGALFEFIKNAFVWLDKNDSIANFHIKFLLELTRFMGFYPNIENDNHPYFNLESGSTTHLLPRGRYLESTLKNKWISILGTNFDKSLNVSLNKLERSSLIEHIIFYFGVHLQNFKNPRSTAVLNEVFKHF